MLAIVLAALVPWAIAYPSGDTIPERLVRMSIVFSVPQDESIARTVILRAAFGDLVEPFADPPLWSADRRTLTLVLDPSRQKSGLANHRELGYVLPAAHDVALVVGERAIKHWHVLAGGCVPLDPRAWRIQAPRTGTLRPIVVKFRGPLDVLSRDFLAVADAGGMRVAGTARFVRDERSWRFTPDAPWGAGLRLAIHPRLEDPCGDEIGEAFEHRAGRGLGTKRATTFIPLSSKILLFARVRAR